MKDSDKKLPYSTIIFILMGVLFLAVIGSVVLGRYPIGIKELGGIIASQFIQIEPFWIKTQESLLLNHRLPRIILACLVGCCLASAGSAYQGVFQNHMSAPDILGASSGAAFGASLAIVMELGNTMIIVFAFASSLLTVALVIFVGNHAKGNRVLGLILSGIMLGSLVSSGTSFIKLMADPNEQLPQITYWLMGSLNGTRPEDVWFVLIPMTIGLVGNNYKHLMPASMLLGAIFLLLVDDISRNLFATEIPIGILISVIGAPFFIYLITREED